MLCIFNIVYVLYDLKVYNNAHCQFQREFTPKIGYDTHLNIELNAVGQNRLSHHHHHEK